LKCSFPNNTILYDTGTFFTFIIVLYPVPHPHHRDKLDPGPHPHQNFKLDEDPDPNQFADDKPKCMKTSGFWPRVRARARTRLFGLIKMKNGALRPPPGHRSFAAPPKIKKIFQKQNASLLA
jgi:hypothetical protein